MPLSLIRNSAGKRLGSESKQNRPCANEIDYVAQQCFCSSQYLSQTRSCVNMLHVADYSENVFGCPEFCHVAACGGWCVISNHNMTSPVSIYSSDTDSIRLYHGTTLHQARSILQLGFYLGKYHTGTKTHPCGLWGTDHPGHSLDRSPLMRGWSFTGEPTHHLSGWDCPVALCFTARRSSLKVLRFDGWRKLCLRGTPGTMLNVRSLRLEIWINRKLYANFNTLTDVWHRIKEGELYVCRARTQCPEDLYNCGSCKAMTCGSYVESRIAYQSGWTRTTNSGQWRCSRCAQNSRMREPNFD